MTTFDFLTSISRRHRAGQGGVDREGPRPSSPATEPGTRHLLRARPAARQVCRPVHRRQPQQRVDRPELGGRAGAALGEQPALPAGVHDLQPRVPDVQRRPRLLPLLEEHADDDARPRRAALQGGAPARQGARVRPVRHADRRTSARRRPTCSRRRRRGSSRSRSTTSSRSRGRRHADRGHLREDGRRRLRAQEAATPDSAA